MSEAILARQEGWASEAAALRRWLAAAVWAARNVPVGRLNPGCTCLDRGAYAVCSEDGGVLVCREHGRVHVCEDGGCADLVSANGMYVCPLTGRPVRMAVGDVVEACVVGRQARKRARLDESERAMTPAEEQAIESAALAALGTAEERRRDLGGPPLPRAEAEAAAACIAGVARFVWARVSRLPKRRAQLKNGARACTFCVAGFLRDRPDLYVANRRVCAGSPWFGGNVLPDTALAGMLPDHMLHTLRRDIDAVWLRIHGADWEEVCEAVAGVMANSALPST